MWISIREQLAFIVLFSTLIALAVLATATWITNDNFVIGVSLANLSLTASLYAGQLVSNLAILKNGVQAIATRVLLQQALRRYNENGNTSDMNWTRAISDLQIAISGNGPTQYLLQARMLARDSTGPLGTSALMNVTGSSAADDHILLPYTTANGSAVYLGDEEDGFPSMLYPTLDYRPGGVSFDNQNLNASSALFLGPWLVNSTFALSSITIPVVNNTSVGDVLAWMSVVVNSKLIFDVRASLEGLGGTGVLLLIGPANPSNRFSSGVTFNSASQLMPSALDQESVRFVVPPLNDLARSTRHPEATFANSNHTFTLSQYEAVESAVTIANHGINNAGAMLDSRNENDDSVAVGFAFTMTDLVDWVVIAEQAHDEMMQPRYHLRNVILACVFGTVGGILLFLVPLAHFSVTPIRRLRCATKHTLRPHGIRDHALNDSHSAHNSSGNAIDQAPHDDDAVAAMARKKGFVQRITKWRRASPDTEAEWNRATDRGFHIPSKVLDHRHYLTDELTDLTSTFNEMSEELMMQYTRLEDRVKERTQELEASKKLAEKANESKTLFIANISHELKTPLNGIMGMCAVCMSEDDPTKIKRSLGIIYKSGDLLLHLLTDLLTFSKNEVGQQITLEEKEFRLTDVSSQILSIFDKQAKDGGIQLRVAFGGPSESLDTASGLQPQPGYGPVGTGKVKDMYVYGDAHRILQVIINLVSNSVKFTPIGGSVVVRIKCIGEATAEKAASSRKDSTISRQTKASRISNRFASVRPRFMPHSPGSSTSGGHSGSERGDGQAPPEHAMAVRDATPPPINARTLLFEFEVEDTGPGIPLSQQQQVFLPFMQGDLGLSRKFGGTGLGLSICTQLANLMRGSMTLRSEEGVGSTFSMRIPLRFTKERADSTGGGSVLGDSYRNSTTDSILDDVRGARLVSSEADLSLHSRIDGPALNGFEPPRVKSRLVRLSQPFFATTTPLDSPEAQLEAIEKVALAVQKTGDKTRVLVAEDNKVNQEVVLRMLKLEDIYDVTVAKDGQEALDLVKQSMEQKKFFNVIFMDIQMPNLDGLQSTRLIREMGYSAPIVALSAFAEESNVKECMDSGMDFFLPKPIRRPALKQVLKRYCPTIPEAEDEPESPGTTRSNPLGRESTPAAGRLADMVPSRASSTRQALRPGLIPHGRPGSLTPDQADVSPSPRSSTPLSR